MYDTILVATDGNEPSESVVRYALDLAEWCDATLHALFVVDSTVSNPAHRDFLEEWGARATNDIVARATKRGLTAVGAVESGRPHRHIVEYATRHGIDVIVIGTHGHGRFDRFLLGSVADKVVRSSSVPVLVVPTLKR